MNRGGRPCLYNIIYARMEDSTRSPGSRCYPVNAVDVTIIELHHHLASITTLMLMLHESTAQYKDLQRALASTNYYHRVFLRRHFPDRTAPVVLLSEKPKAFVSSNRGMARKPDDIPKF